MANILLVDDDSAYVEETKTFMEDNGHKVSAAYSGQEAWDMLHKTQPDIIILDGIMEEFTSGFDLAHDINLKFPKLPLIMLSVIREHMSSEWRFGIKDREWLPINSFIEKPADPHRLLQEIKRLL